MVLGTIGSWRKKHGACREGDTDIATAETSATAAGIQALGFMHTAEFLAGKMVIANYTAAMSGAKSIDVSKGPISQENWKASLKGEPLYESMEWPLYTDAWLTGEVRGELGPYAFLNLIAVQHGFGMARPAAILRIDMHLSPDCLPDMSKTDYAQFHGGTFADEMAALTSLLLGVRMKASGASRTFEASGDAKGRPIGWDVQPPPALRVRPFGRVIPAAASERSLNTLVDDLSALPKVGAGDAIAFVRSARLYQEGLWVSESEPSLAWLLMVFEH